MKEYIAQAGGRYTYADDIENLQTLALSMTSLFEGCDPFIIAGCEVEGMKISPGYLWLGGKIRRFEGCTDAVFPYYLYETNRTESVVYANEENKLGRLCHLCAGSGSIPTVSDLVTGAAPRYIEVRADYAPRLADGFFGRYALLTDTPFARQTLHRDLTMSGALTVGKEVASRTALTVVDDAGGRAAQLRLRPSGDVSLGCYLHGLPVLELLLTTDGQVRFMKQERELASLTTEGLRLPSAAAQNMRVGSVLLEGNHIANIEDNTDGGAVCVNYTGFECGATCFRNFEVYDGKGSARPLLAVVGRSAETRVGGLLTVLSAGRGLSIVNTSYLKDDPKLTGAVTWRDSDDEILAEAGYLSPEDFEFSLRNTLGGIVLRPRGWVDIEGDLRIRGIDIAATYLSKEDFAAAMAGKVDVLAGKQLSTEDFTSEHRRKLEAITTSGIQSEGTGYVTAASVSAALDLRLEAAQNLADIPDKGAARLNMDVYSKAEATARFLTVSGGLGELVALTAEEINGLSPEQAGALKAQRQQAVRTVLDAEKAGTGALKLSKASNLADVADKDAARRNLDVYSIDRIDGLLARKLDSANAYAGVLFTEELRGKLESIQRGVFAYTDDEGTSHALVEGYATTSEVVQQLDKKAARLMDGYNTSEKETIASNLGIYTRTAADGRFACVERLLQDYITYLVGQGKTTAEAQQTLREKFDVLSKDEIVQGYLRRDAKLSDLVLASDESRRQACRTLGAAYAEEYQPRLADTGWLRMSDSGSGTDARNLFIRQIGNIVSIQGSVNTAKRDGGNQGGTLALIPNALQPPKYSVRCTAANWNDDHTYNRGCSFVVYGGSRKVQLFESGMYNVDVELNFTYFV
uniref:hypothetical protein n=1 Tax=Alistipes sp. D31t1_170403_E11 TaxID=2787128 RepID=UPI001897D373|nr:hypothetical protein [Alistipes sp. D31t1_170403_E11]